MASQLELDEKSTETGSYKPEADNYDLGFGSVLAQESRQRLLNRDGSFNVTRIGLRRFSSVNSYHLLLTMSWWRFLIIVAALYLLINVTFAVIYTLLGDGAVIDTSSQPISSAFWRSFFFSVQTFGSIGYGVIQPSSFNAEWVVTIEAFTALLSQALVTGMLFARFSRPTAKIVFSKTAVVAPFQDATAFMFRIVNGRSNQLIEIRAQVLFSRFVIENGKTIRRFDSLKLERQQVTFFSLSWTIVHQIDEASPLYGLTHQDLTKMDAELMILLTGIDETFSQTVHTRSSYKPSE
ncbi:MAG: hypothetical protein H7Z37_07915, partial [Pyrinomonadaceae bacterium]|nr:hypothetical protein [Pyrinomonadaceae bacterium]